MRARRRAAYSDPTEPAVGAQTELVQERASALEHLRKRRAVVHRLLRDARQPSAERRQAPIPHVLVERPHDVPGPQVENHQGLKYAASADRPDVARLLLDAGASPSFESQHAAYLAVLTALEFKRRRIDRATLVLHDEALDDASLRNTERAHRATFAVLLLCCCGTL